ncbi:MAG: two pore domain potassium channel family protein [Chloroflexi bacterium]|nr:MAG: two pore domain potassium channel family protein [Chloroflexota bacterium]
MNLLSLLAALASILLILIVLQDGFETIILPRRVSRKFRLARMFYGTIWRLWSWLARRVRSAQRREEMLSFFGPFSLILLLTLWATMLIFAFGLLQWAMADAISAPEKGVTFGTTLYMSGTTFFTLGFGDVVPHSGLSRFCAVAEAGIGFAFLALVIGYVPVIYQAFSRREVGITLLDARAGSPPTTLELLRRHISGQDTSELAQYLHDWEHWSADLLESHLSYPVLAYYRSQHDRQSWLAALTTILDTCALMMIGLNGESQRTATFTFAIARHAAVDLAQIFNTPPANGKVDRLPTETFQQLRAQLADFGFELPDDGLAEAQLAGLRRMYEPYVNALAAYLLLPLPEWISTEYSQDDWQSSAWEHASVTTQLAMARAQAEKKNIVTAQQPGSP